VLRSGRHALLTGETGQALTPGGAAPALEDVHVDLDAQARALRRIGVAILDAERVRQQVLA
jgi:hypothetical protein